MAGQEPTIQVAAQVAADVSAACKVEVQWPLTFRLECNGSNAAQMDQYWSHKAYRGPKDQKVEVIYCDTLEKSEAAAKRFLNERVLGFDMEWPMPWHFSGVEGDLKDKVAMIQIASEERIALFHIGRHMGTTAKQLIANSLRKIIESPEIVKTGHNIMAADCSKLAKHFDLKPRAIFELVHLHWLITHGPTDPSKVLTKVRGIRLDGLVEEHLGRKLLKDDKVRMCNWKWAVNEDRKTYAAADAYAGVILYHVLNYKRQTMDPSPPMPLHAELYLPYGSAKYEQIRLESTEAGKAYTTAEEFFRVEDREDSQQEVEKGEKGEGEPKEGTSGDGQAHKEDTPKSTAQTAKKQSRTTKELQKTVSQPLDAISAALYLKLAERRKSLAVEKLTEPIRVATNETLKAIARQRPQDEKAMLKIKGIGKVTFQRYGEAWVKVIAEFQATPNGPSEPEPVEVGMRQDAAVKAAPVTTALVPASPMPQQPMIPQRRRALPASQIADSAAFGNSRHPIPQLHTGLSDVLANATIAPQKSFGTECKESSDDSDAFATPPSQPLSQRKRKRPESPVLTETHSHHGRIRKP